MERADDVRFTDFLLSKSAEARRAGYPPNNFERMLHSQLGFTTVSSLLATRNPSEGFERLWEMKRLDLSVEALVLESEWKPFFYEELLKIARDRLRASGYSPREFLPRTPTPPLPPVESIRRPADPVAPGAPTSAPAAALEAQLGRALKITGPVENFLTGILRGFWALNETNRGQWDRLREGDIVVFHSTRDSAYATRPPSSIIGFARVGEIKRRKEEPWWPQELASKENLWPYTFSLTDICITSPNGNRIDLSRRFEAKSPAEIAAEVLVLLEGAIPIADVEAKARELAGDVPHFPVNGSIAMLSEAYKRAVLATPAQGWAQLRPGMDPEDLAGELLSREDLASVEASSRADLLAKAKAFVPSGPSHTRREARVRIDNAIQKHRIACLEDFTCQVCSYKQGYSGKTGIQRWIVHVDHIHDKADSGDERLENLWVLCPTCHCEKTAGVLKIDPTTFAVTRLGTSIPIRNNHLPLNG